MKRFLILLALTTLPGCARIFAEPDWVFDCDWARFRDFQDAAEGRLGGAAFGAPGQWTKMLCNVDPSTVEYWGSRRRPATKPLPDERK